MQRAPCAPRGIAVSNHLAPTEALARRQSELDRAIVAGAWDSVRELRLAVVELQRMIDRCDVCTSSASALPMFLARQAS